MNKWLASIQSLEEAQSLLPILPDILDMKNPSEGALGALSVERVTDIVKLIDGRCLTSATIGDLPMQADLISIAMNKMATSGVDYVKIGLFPETALKGCIKALESSVRNLKIPVIAVFFADKFLDVDCVSLIKSCGFKGIMIDTAIKNGQCLLDHWDESQLSAFVDSVQSQSMICGLAGALRMEDIPLLRSLNADYLGFRSALCLQKQRQFSLQLERVKQIRNAMRG